MDFSFMYPPDEVMKFGIYFYCILLVAADWIYTLKLIRLQTKLESFEQALKSETNWLAQKAIRQLGLFPGIVLMAAAASLSVTLIVLTSPLWMAGFMFGYYTNLVTHHYHENKGLKELENMESQPQLHKAYN